MVKLENNMTIANIIKIAKENLDINIDNRELWYDWFCKTSSLQNRGKALLSRLRSVVRANAKNPNPKFDPEKCYVFFKNNCPCCGSLTDDFRICDIETGDVLYTITPKSGYDANYGNAEIWGKDNTFNDAIVDGTWKEVLAFFKG